MNSICILYRLWIIKSHLTAASRLAAGGRTGRDLHQGYHHKEDAQDLSPLEIYGKDVRKMTAWKLMADSGVVDLLRMRKLVVEEWYSEIMCFFFKRIYDAVEI